MPGRAFFNVVCIVCLLGVAEVSAGELMQGGPEYCMVRTTQYDIDVFGPWNFKKCHFPEMVRNDLYSVEKVELAELRQRLKDALMNYKPLNIVIVAQDWSFNFFHKYRHKKVSDEWKSGLWTYGRNPFGHVVTKRRVGLPEDLGTTYTELLKPGMTAYIFEKKSASIAQK